MRPGSPEAARLKDALIAQGAWSQYLEVGIGPDAEIFTKSQPMSAVGTGAEIGIHPKSEWNNPEPEIVLVVGSRGRTVGATLGNDVNLRDFEGRSALLLGKAKDNNASCAIGPFIRLFDEHFAHRRRAPLRARDARRRPRGLRARRRRARIAMISRDPLDLVAQAIGPNHQYPDGLVLFLGTMFAPTQDRHGPGQGFTHVVGDIVTVDHADARRARQPREHVGPHRAVDVRRGRADEEPRAAQHPLDKRCVYVAAVYLTDFVLLVSRMPRRARLLMSCARAERPRRDAGSDVSTRLTSVPSSGVAKRSRTSPSTCVNPWPVPAGPCVGANIVPRNSTKPSGYWRSGAVA